MKLQNSELFREFDRLHKTFGDKNSKPIYGAGQITSPNLFFIFMNPTIKNVAASPEWRGIRAPWLGTKNVWKLFYRIKILDKSFYSLTQKLTPSEWTPEFSYELYSQISKKSVYITNLAKCTQSNAKPIGGRVFKSHLTSIKDEITRVSPKKIITLGNLVSSLLLGKSVKISNYEGKSENLILDNEQFPIYPVYYPVGQGMRNLNKAVTNLKKIMVSSDRIN